MHKKPSQALTRQLSQRESQETLQLAPCLSLWERWHCEAMTKRASTLKASKIITTEGPLHEMCSGPFRLGYV